jgi:3'(2'), 5'-bisphosphate nucleotidase
MSLEKLCTAAIPAAIEAGKATLDIYHTDFPVERKDDDSPVTRADRLSHDIIEKSLAPWRIPMLSEEGKQIPYDTRKTWDLLWMVDPLDGTKEFIKKNGEFTVNIALIRKSRPVLGVIYVPVYDRLFFAAQNVGAYALDHAASVVNFAGQPQNLQNAFTVIIKKSIRLPASRKQNPTLTIVGSRSHGTDEFDRFAESIRRKTGEIKLTSAGSSVKFCLVAEGSADIYPRFGSTMEWDTAAGQAIVENAGMRVLDAKTGAPLRYNKEYLLNPWFIAGKETVLSLSGL